MSTVASVHPLAAALAKAEMFTRATTPWRGVTDRQRAFFADVYPAIRADLPRCSEIEAIADRSVDPVNAFLRERGFTIQLDQLTPAADGLAVAAVLDLLGQWLRPGEDADLRLADGTRSVPGVLMTHADAYRTPAHPAPVVGVTTKAGDHVYMSVCPTVPADVGTYAASVQASLRATSGFRGVHFPKVDLRAETDLSWIEGADLAGYAVAQALQQSVLKMNEAGFRAKSAVAVSMLRAATFRSTPPVVIDRPFLFWISRAAFAAPLFAAHVTEDAFRDPGTLD